MQYIVYIKILMLQQLNFIKLYNVYMYLYFVFQFLFVYLGILWIFLFCLFIFNRNVLSIVYVLSIDRCFVNINYCFNIEKFFVKYMFLVYV